MGFRDRMKKKRKALTKRHNEQVKKAGQGGGGRFPTIFLKDKIPAGVEFFRCKEGEHLIDILPWEVGPDMPLDERNKPITDEGDLDYVLDIYVHQNVGSMQKPYVCPYENFGEPCPICEYIKMKRPEKAEWSKIRAKRRVIYLVWVHDDRENEKKGVQIFEAAHFFMEEKISEIAKLPRGGGSIVFSDYEDGKTLAWTRKGSGRDNTQYLGHKFIDREGPIPNKILDQTFALDSIVNMYPKYDEIHKAFHGDVKEEEEKSEDSTGDDVPFYQDEEKPKKKKKKKRKRPTDRTSDKPRKKKKRRKV